MGLWLGESLELGQYQRALARCWLLHLLLEEHLKEQLAVHLDLGVTRVEALNSFNVSVL